MMYTKAQWDGATEAEPMICRGAANRQAMPGCGAKLAAIRAATGLSNRELLSLAEARREGRATRRPTRTISPQQWRRLMTYGCLPAPPRPNPREALLTTATAGRMAGKPAPQAVREATAAAAIAAAILVFSMEFRFEVAFGSPDARVAARGAGPYSSRLRLTIPEHWYTVVVRDLATAGAMLTLAADPLPGTDGAYNAVWVARHGLRECRVHRGVILRRPGGGWIHGRDLAHCRRIARRSEAEAARQARAVPTAPEVLATQYGSVRVFRADSIRAGNCPTGTDSWVSAHMPGRRSATVAEVLAADTSRYAIAACIRAVRRRG